MLEGTKRRLKGLAARVVPPRRVAWCLRRRALRGVALTFDDGPDPEATPRMLATLRELDARATFFLLGEKIAGHPDLVKEILREGHEVGLHGWSHRILTELTRSELEDEIRRCDETLSACGAETRLYRPPFGVLPWRHLRLLWGLGRTVVLWNVDSGDWGAEDREQVTGRVRASSLRRGDIILFHEKSAVTPDVVAEVGAQLVQRGIGLVTVSRLIAGSG